MRPAALALGLLALVATGPASAQSLNLDALGARFCALTSSGDLAGLRPLLSPSLTELIISTFAARNEPAPAMLFQSYSNRVPDCAARTRNAAIIEIRRSGEGGSSPAWTEYVVVAPDADGSTRIDDVLFATRRSDTLRARLTALGN